MDHASCHAALPAIIFIVAIALFPDTARYLATRGNREKARDSLSHVRGLDREHIYIKSEMNGISSQIEAAPRGTSTINQLFKNPSNRRRLFLAAGLMVAQSMSVYYSISYDQSRHFLATARSGYETTMYTSVLNGALEIVSCIMFTLFVIDSCGRRKSLLCTIAVQMICLFAVGTLSAVWHNIVYPAAEKVFDVELVFIYLCNCVFQFGLGPVPIIYAVEIPTTQMRAMTMGLAVALQWLFTMGLDRALPYMLLYVGQTGSGELFAVFVYDCSDL